MDKVIVVSIDCSNSFVNDDTLNYINIEKYIVDNFYRKPITEDLKKHISDFEKQIQYYEPLFRIEIY